MGTKRGLHGLRKEQRWARKGDARVEEGGGQERGLQGLRKKVGKKEGCKGCGRGGQESGLQGLRKKVCKKVGCKG